MTKHRTARLPVEPTREMEPTDAEMLAFAEEEQFFLFCDGDEFLQIARAVMRRYSGRQTTAQREPMAWVTEDTVDGQEVNGKARRIWWENNEGVGIPIYATTPAVQVEPVAAQHRFRHPQKSTPDWSDWQPAAISLDRPSWEIDSQGYEVEYRLLYDAPQQAEQQLPQDVKDLRKLLWAAAMTAGGKLVIEDKHIHHVNDECRLHRYDDVGLRRVVFSTEHARLTTAHHKREEP